MLHVKVQDGVIDSSRWAHAAGVHVRIDRLYLLDGKHGSVNLGHTLGDEVIAVWRALEMWGLLEEPVHVYLNDITATKPYHVLNLAKPPVLASSGLNESTCFESFVVGWSNFGYMPTINPNYRPPDTVPKSYLNRFRDYSWRRFGAVGLPIGHWPPRITIVCKGTAFSMFKAAILNVDALKHAFETRFGARVELAVWQGMPLAKQVQIMSQTDVMLSLPGSDLMNAVWLPTKSAIVVPWRYILGWTSKGRDTDAEWHPSNEVRLWFDHIPFRQVISFNPALDPSTKLDNSTGGVELGINRTSATVEDALVHLAQLRVLNSMALHGRIGD